MQKKINVLVVDDEEVMRSLFTDILKDEGHKVTTACNGEEAKDKLKEAFFDIAFVDVHMPVMDGAQTVQAIREVSPKTAVVMMDSYPDLILAEALRTGAVTCIHKPFDIKEVKGMIGEVLKKEKTK